MFILMPILPRRETEPVVWQNFHLSLGIGLPSGDGGHHPPPALVVIRTASDNTQKTI